MLFHPPTTQAKAQQRVSVLAITFQRAAPKTQCCETLAPGVRGFYVD